MSIEAIKILDGINKDKTFSFSILKQMDKVVSDIQKLLEHSFSIENNNCNLDSSANNIIEYLKNIIPVFKDNNFLDSYFDINNNVKDFKIENKIEKNLMIFLPVLVKFIENKCKEDNVSINSKEGKKIIFYYIKNLFNILFIFGDKIDFYLLEKLLEEESEELIIKKDFLINYTNELGNNEKELNSNISADDNEVNDYLIEQYLPSIYRVCYKRGQKEYYKYLDEKDKSEDDNNDKDLNFFISKNIEEEIFSIYRELYALFIKSIELTDNIETRLSKLKQSFDKIFGYIDILSANKLAFTNLNKNTLYVDELTNKALNSDFNNNLPENKIFLLFLDGKKNNFISNTKDALNLYKKEKLDVGIDNTEGKSANKTIKETTFNEWEHMSPDISCKIFLSQLLIKQKNGNISLSDELNISYSTDSKAIKSYSTLYKFDKEVVLSQFNKIITLIKSGITLRNFIKQDINDVQLLYTWWRYILATKMKNTKKRKEAYVKLTERPLGLIEVITNNLIKEGRLDSNKLDFNPNGRLSNMSGMNVGASIDYTFYSSAKGNIDFKNYNIGRFLLTNENDLYSVGEEATLEETIDFINNGIDTTIKILQGNFTFSEENNKYVRILKNLGIIPNDISKINISTKDNLTKLIEGLKVMIGGAFNLNDMLKIAKDNYDSVSDLFTPLFKNKEGKNEKINDGLGPDKNFGRAFIKLMTNHKGDYHKLSDLNRLRVNRNGITELNTLFLDFIEIANNCELISNVSVDDWTGNPLNFPRKKSGYKDLKALLTLKSGAVVEFQFHYTQMLEVKELGKKIDNETQIKLKAEKSLLNIRELKQFSKVFFELIKKPIDISLLASISGIEKSEINNKINTIYFSEQGRNSISCDNTYDLIRNLPKNSTLRKKLTRLERIFFDTTWSDIVIKDAEDNEVDL